MVRTVHTRCGSPAFDISQQAEGKRGGENRGAAVSEKFMWPRQARCRISACVACRWCHFSLENLPEIPRRRLRTQDSPVLDIACADIRLEPRCIKIPLVNHGPPSITDEVERYLLTGSSDPLYAVWPGNILESARLAPTMTCGAHLSTRSGGERRGESSQCPRDWMPWQSRAPKLNPWCAGFFLAPNGLWCSRCWKSASSS